MRRLFHLLLPDYRRNGWQGMMIGILFGAVTMLAIVWGIALQGRHSENQLRIQTVLRQQENIAFLVAQQLNQLVERGRMVTTAAADTLTHGSHNPRVTLNSLSNFDAAFNHFAIYDRQARRIFSTREGQREPPQLRELMTRFGQQTTPDDKQGAGTPELWQSNLLYPVGLSNGKPRGFLLASLDLPNLLSLYRNLDFGSTGLVQILDLRGNILSEIRRDGIATFPPGTTSPLLASEQAIMADWPSQLSDDAESYLSTIRRVDNTPFSVAVGRKIAEVHEDHGILPLRLLVLLAGLSALLVVGALWMFGLARYQQKLFQSLQDANRENQSLIERLEVEKQKAFQLAAHDHLTGLQNRRMFHEMAGKLLAQGARQETRHALLYLDLDRFKSINDGLGHHVGDLLLQRLAERLRCNLRESDLIARLGGDEFAVLLTNLDGRESAALVAGKLIECIEVPYENLGGNSLRVGTSIGIAIFPDDGRELDQLCRHADEAMYQAKRSGRGRYCFYEPENGTDQSLQFRIEQALPHAIAQNELSLYFQPKVSLEDYRIVGLEALLRWNSSKLGAVRPDVFIPVAENSGHILPLGRWVIENCCRQLAEWRAKGEELLPIAFNLSPKQLHDTELPAFIVSTLARYGLRSHLLEAEITESCLIDGGESSYAVLNELEKLGLGIALDDFGNGFSNLSYLRILPIAKVKIDRSFVADIRNSTADATIVASMISLVHQLGLEVVAEGVEHREQVSHLRAAGCDEIQGYYFSPPVPAAEVGELLRRGQLEPA